MMTMLSKAFATAGLAALALISTAQDTLAIPVILNPGDSLVVEWSMNSAPAPLELGRVSLGFWTITSGGGTTWTDSLYDDGALLGSSGPNGAFTGFVRSGSFWTNANSVDIDFASIDDGTILGVFTHAVAAGFRSFDTDDVFIGLTKEAGGSLTGVAVVTSVSIVPEPSAALLVGIGLAGLAAVRRPAS
jgi:hypothetical protein